MYYNIIYNKNNRIRVRCGAYAFTDKQGYGISSILLREKYIENVITNSSNGSILIIYKDNNLNNILKILNNIKKEDIIEKNPSGEQLLNKIDNDFQKNFLNLILKKFLSRIIFPKTIRILLTIFQASKYIKDGIKSIISGKLDISVLDATSICISISQGSYKTANSIMFLLSISGLLEEYTKERTKNALTNSIAINVDNVWLITNKNKEILTPLNRININDCIKIRKGSLIPLDGTIVEGNAIINESTITGEPIGVNKFIGNTVYAGTIVEEGSIIIKVNTLSNETRISKIIELIEESENLKANIQSKAENLSDSIVGFSFIGAIFIGLLTKNLTKAISVLMVDYSCAIKLSTPIAVISAMREASINNIMVKGGKHLETFANADTIIFDKTGTITNACPQVKHIETFGEYTEKEILKISACIEEHFPHSIARAVVQKAKDEGLYHEEEHAEVEYIVAHGVSTQIYGKKAIIGSSHFVFEDEKTELTEQDKQKINNLSKDCSFLYLAIGGKLAGIICINDPPRKEAKYVIKELKNIGINNIIMLTGDHENAAKSICNEIGISEYKAQVLPEEKANIINNLKSKGHCIIMVGDGINDSPALATANVSVAMKDSSDLARDISDITLLSTDLRELIKLRKLSQLMIKRIHRNYNFIINFNTILLLFGILGIMKPTTTALLHNISTMGVSANSMKLYISNKQKINN